MDQLLVFTVAVGSGFAATYLARAMAHRVGLVDKPDGRRKIHTRPVAVAGGIGVFVGSLAALLTGAVFVPDLAAALVAETPSGFPRFVPMLGAAAVIAAVGLADDLLNLRARYKLAGQVLAALILIGPGGLVIEEVSVFGAYVVLGPMAVPATVFWLLATMNALNLLDGMDGFLGTVAVIACAAISFMAFANGQVFVGWVMLVTAGAVVGFLRFNLPPASVYLGDCGSLTLGLVVGAAALQASLKEATVAIVGPACLLILPMLDTTAAIVRRKLTGRGLAVGDRGHLHHVLKANGLPVRRVLALVAALGCVAAGGAFGSVVLRQDVYAVVAAGAVVLILLAGGLFGNAEWRLVRERATGMLKKAGGRGHVELEVRLQGSADWQAVWREVTRAAEDLNLHTVCLDVNAPAWHEGYHRRWDRLGRGAASELNLWRVELPLCGHGQVIGRLTVAGVRDDVPVAEKMRVVAEFLEAAEARAVEVARGASVARPSQGVEVGPPFRLPTPA